VHQEASTRQLWACWRPLVEHWVGGAGSEWAAASINRLREERGKHLAAEGAQPETASLPAGGGVEVP
jgi:hypothetical protein